MVSEWKVPVQSLIDHIKTAVDVDPWAKEMAEELLKKQEAVPPKEKAYAWRCGKCDEYLTAIQNHRIRYCPYCGQAVKWE